MKALTFILFSLFVFQADDATMEKMAKSEAKLLCSCYKTFDKKQAKHEKKSLDGTIDFSVMKCLKERRSGKIQGYIDGLSEEDNGMFKRLVFQNIDESCPNVRLKK